MHVRTGQGVKLNKVFLYKAIYIYTTWRLMRTHQRHIQCIYIIASVASYMYELAGAILWYNLYIFVSMGRPLGPAWAPRNAQRANVGPAGLGSKVNIIALKTATLVLSRG